MLKGKGKELRRCRAYTLEGLGDQCKKWAMNNTNYCYHHTMSIALGKQSDEDKELKRQFPKLYKRKQLRCKCSAYPFPHFIGTGICRWPFSPTHRWTPSNDPALHRKHPEQEAKEKLRALGVKNKRTSFIRWFRTGRIESIRPEDLKPEDHTLLEDYLKDYVELPDWSSLPIDVKRQRIKEQMVEALKNEVQEKEILKHCLNTEANSTQPRVSRKASHDPSYGADSEDEAPLHYKIIKEKVRQRNGEIVEKSYMILETGEKVPLQ